MDTERLKQIMGSFQSLRIAVIGDFFLDKYMEVDAARAESSLETGLTAHQVVDVRCSPGAAGNVVSNLAALGCGTVHAVGFIGDDGEGYELVKCLEALGCDTGNLIKAAGRRTPTYLKPRDMTVPGLEGEHPRYDTKNYDITPQEVEREIIGRLDALLDDLDAVMIVEQDTAVNCGVITQYIREHLIRRAKEHPEMLFFADSRPYPLSFEHIVIKPNQFEVMGIENTRDAEGISMDMRMKNGAPVFVTLGAEGMLVSDPEPLEIRAVKVTGQVDTTGAGDSAASGIVLALASGASAPEAALVGNLAASVTVQKLAVCGTCAPQELMRQLEVWLAQRGL